MSRTATNLSSTKIYGLGRYLTHWRIYWIHSQRHFYGRSSEEPNQPGVLRAHGKCRDNSRLVYPVCGSLYPAKLGFKCRSPRWVLPHQVKARLVGKRGMENEVRHCLRLLFSGTGHCKKKKECNGHGWGRECATGAWHHCPGVRVVMEGKVLLPLDFLPLLQNFQFPCLQLTQLQLETLWGPHPNLLAFAKHKNQLQVCELYPWARCMKAQQSPPDLHVFVDLDLVHCLYM